MNKFIISSGVLKKMLHKVSHAIRPNSILPVCGSVWCKVTKGSLEMIATDTEITISSRQDCESTSEGFEFLMPFLQILKLLSFYEEQPLEFTQEKKGVKFKAQNISGAIDVHEINSPSKLEDFPRLQTLPKKASIPVDEKLIDWLRTAMETVGSDEVKYPAQTKVLLELRSTKTTIASSDRSFVMFSYSMDLPSPADQDILISPKVIKSLDGINEANLFWNEKVFAFVSTDLTVVVTRPDLKFVNFRHIIPADYNSNLTLKREELRDALEKCNINSDPFKETVLHFKKGKVVLSAKDSRFGLNFNIEIPGDYTGTLTSLKFSCDKMLKLMNQTHFETIEIAAHDLTRPILFRASDDAGYLGLLMPMATPEKK